MHSSSLDCPQAPLVCQHVILPIFSGDQLHFHRAHCIVAYLGSWALIAPIIAAKFLLNYHTFLLEMIGANDFGPFLFQIHLKLM